MKKLLALAIIAAAAPATAGQITESAFSAQTTINDFSWATTTNSNTVSNSGIDFTTNPGGVYPSGGFRAFGGYGRDGSNALYDNQGETNFTINLNGSYQRVGIDVNIGPASYNISFFDAASNLLGTIAGTDVGTNDYFFAGFESLTGIASLTILETSGDNGRVGGIDNLRLDTAAAAVPEPAMLGLFGMGAIGLGLSRRRKAA